MAPADATITSAAPTAEPVAHCRVEGYVTTTDPGPNKVNFRLQLPDQNWAGRYYFIGIRHDRQAQTQTVTAASGLQRCRKAA